MNPPTQDERELEEKLLSGETVIAPWPLMLDIGPTGLPTVRRIHEPPTAIPSK